MRGSGGVFVVLMDGSHSLDSPPAPICTHSGLRVRPDDTPGAILRTNVVGVAEVSALGTFMPRLLKVMVLVGGAGETATGNVETVTFFEPSLLDLV